MRRLDPSLIIARRTNGTVWAVVWSHRRRLIPAAALVAIVLLTAGCGGSAPATPAHADPSQVPTPVGAGARFRPGPGTPPRRTGALRCTTARGARFGTHLELFAAGRVVVVPAGIGIVGRRSADGIHVDRGACWHAAVTREPTGVIEVRPGAPRTLADLFRVWGQPLSATALAGFHGRVRAFVGGHAWRGDPRAIPLARHAEVVLEVGPRIPPHRRYGFPPGL